MKEEKPSQCTEVHFASFLSGGFTTTAVINPPEKKLAKCTSVHCREMRFTRFPSGRFTRVFEVLSICGYILTNEVKQINLSFLSIFAAFDINDHDTRTMNENHIQTTVLNKSSKPYMFV